MWFVRSILKNVVVDEVAMNNDQNIDEVLTGEMVTFYKIVAFVMEVNFGDFFETLKTLLDSSAPLDFVGEA